MRLMLVQPLQLVAVPLIAMLLLGCSTSGYVLEQAWGQLKVMHKRQRIEEVLQQPDLKPEWREKLALTLLVRSYAHEEIGLRLTAAYTRFYDTGGKPLAYNLSACPKDRLKPKIWRFPIVGALPYLGYFDKRKGIEAQGLLDAEGLDTLLRPVPAFSSLGWFADPVYSSMLDGPVSRLVEVIIHETTHTTIFLRGKIAFNESLATFVGNQGALNFLARVYGPLSGEVKAFKRSVSRRLIFSKLIRQLYTEVDALYNSDLTREEKLSRREPIFKRAQDRYKELFPDPAHWGRFVQEPLNNAILLKYGRYNQGLTFHQRVYLAVGRDLHRFVLLYKHAQKFDDPIAYVARVCKLDGFIKQQM